MARSGYDFYLKKCLLPVAPKKLQMKIKNANKTITLINEGEVNLLKKAGLTEIEFECEIPQVRYPYAVYRSGFQEAAYFLDYFKKLKTDQAPFQFIVSRVLPSGKLLFNTNIKVSMEDYGITEDANNGFDLTIKIKLKQYQAYQTKIVDIQDSGLEAVIQETRSAETSPEPTEQQQYTVVEGDCLWNIAKKFYGDGSKYTEIYHANQEVIKGSPNVIYPGQVLVIPVV